MLFSEIKAFKIGNNDNEAESQNVKLFPINNLFLLKPNK